jgi:predicted amidohydrolase
MAAWRAKRPILEENSPQSLAGKPHPSSHDQQGFCVVEGSGVSPPLSTAPQMASSLRVVIYQGAGTALEANMRVLDEVLALQHGKADIVVFPELFTGGYFASQTAFGADAVSLESLCETVARRQVAACLGIAVRSAGSGAPFLNQVVVIDDTGQVLLRHTKTHLWGQFEREHFEPGSCLPPVCTLGDFTVSAIICYEVEFAEMVRVLGVRGVEVVLW